MGTSISVINSINKFMLNWTEVNNPIVQNILYSKDLLLFSDKFVINNFRRITDSKIDLSNI